MIFLEGLMTKFLSIMKYNPNFHHRRSVRLKGYDYSKAGLYLLQSAAIGENVSLEKF